MEELERLISHLRGDGGIQLASGDPIELAIEYLEKYQEENSEYSELSDSVHQLSEANDNLEEKVNHAIDYLEKHIHDSNHDIAMIAMDVSHILSN
jgi:hypothetical protein